MRGIKDTILNQGFVLPGVPTHGPKRHNLGHWQVQKQVRFALDMTRQDSNAQFLGANG